MEKRGNSGKPGRKATRVLTGEYGNVYTNRSGVALQVLDIKLALTRCKGNVTEAAKVLDFAQVELHRIIKAEKMLVEGVAEARAKFKATVEAETGENKYRKFTDDDLKQVLIENNGNIMASARQLDVNKMTIYYRLAQNPDLKQIHKASRINTFDAAQNLVHNAISLGYVHRHLMDHETGKPSKEVEYVRVSTSVRLDKAISAMQIFKGDVGVTDRIDHTSEDKTLTGEAAFNNLTDDVLITLLNAFSNVGTDTGNEGNPPG